MGTHEQAQLTKKVKRTTVNLPKGERERRNEETHIHTQTIQCTLCLD